MGHYLFFDLRKAGLYSQNLNVNITLFNTRSKLFTKYSINVIMTGLDNQKELKDI